MHVLASKAKKAAKNHDPLALIAHSNASSSQSHANSSYSPQPYYVTHPSSVVDYEDEYQRELQGDSQEDKLTTAMMLLARAITQKFFTPTNNRLRISSNYGCSTSAIDQNLVFENRLLTKSVFDDGVVCIEFLVKDLESLKILHLLKIEDCKVDDDVDGNYKNHEMGFGKWQFCTNQELSNIYGIVSETVSEIMSLVAAIVFETRGFWC
ncbi:hypothetical protein Tco_0766703 [Tanacetum coccineum]